MLLIRGVLLSLGLGWFGGVIARRAQESSRRTSNYRAILEEDQSTLGVKLTLEAYITNANSTEGVWMQLEPDVGVQLDGSSGRSIAWRWAHVECKSYRACVQRGIEPPWSRKTFSARSILPPL